MIGFGLDFLLAALLIEILEGVVRSVTSDLHGMRLTGPTLLVRWIPMPVPHAR
jgi:hypothetical protein